jgi:hypothetical protein
MLHATIVYALYSACHIHEVLPLPLPLLLPSTDQYKYNQVQVTRFNHHIRCSINLQNNQSLIEI